MTCTCEKQLPEQRSWARVFHKPECPFHHATYVPTAHDRHLVYEFVGELQNAASRCDWQGCRELSSQLLCVLNGSAKEGWRT